MKKNLLLGAVILATTALAGCSTGSTGAAYGLTHGAGYISEATVKMSGDKVTKCTLVEVCFPTQVVAAEGTPEADVVAVTSRGATKNYYKTVVYGDVTMTLDAEKGAYTIGGKTLAEFYANEENAKAYYKAVMGNKVQVVVGGVKKSGIMTKEALNKETNGYWTVGEGTEAYSKWLKYRDLTVDFVVKYGIDKLMATEKDATDGVWKTADASTGATWNDLNSVKEGTISYAQLIKNASLKIAK